MTSRIKALGAFILLSAFLGVGVHLQAANEVGLSGRIYTDYTYNFSNNFNGFNVNRVYLGYEGQLTNSIDYVVTSDVEVGGSSSSSRLFMKYAYGRWKSNCGRFTIGMLPLNAFDVQKKTWGLRYLYKTVMNEYKFSSSADIGVGYEKQVTDEFSISTIISNGTGYKMAENDKYKRLHVRLLFGPDNLGKETGINAGVYGSWEPEKLVDYANNYTIAGFAGIHQNNLWVGAEAAVQQDNTINLQTTLFSVYGRYEVAQYTQAFLRLDTRSFDVTGSDTELAFIAGAQYAKYKGVNVAPNLVYSKIGSNDTVTGRLNFEFRW